MSRDACQQGELIEARQSGAYRWAMRWSERKSASRRRCFRHRRTDSAIRVCANDFH